MVFQEVRKQTVAIQIQTMTHVVFGNQVIYLSVPLWKKIYIQLQRPPGVMWSLQLGAAGVSLGKLSERDSKIIEFGLGQMGTACHQ